MFDGFDSMLINIHYDETVHIYQRRKLFLEQYDPEEYKQKLKKLLHKYFDPYRENAMEWIIRGHYEIGLINENTVAPLRIKAKQYLELDGFKI